MSVFFGFFLNLFVIFLLLEAILKTAFTSTYPPAHLPSLPTHPRTQVYIFSNQKLQMVIGWTAVVLFVRELPVRQLHAADFSLVCC